MELNNACVNSHYAIKLALIFMTLSEYINPRVTGMPPGTIIKWDNPLQIAVVKITIEF